jgi:hypothetical protein
MIDEDDFSSNWWNKNWQGKPKYSEKTYPSATLSTTKSHMTDPVSNPGPAGTGKPATNRLSYGAAVFLVPFCRLLRLAGSRWRYSTPPPHGFWWILILGSSGMWLRTVWCVDTNVRKNLPSPFPGCTNPKAERWYLPSKYSYNSLIWITKEVSYVKCSEINYSYSTPWLITFLWFGKQCTLSSENCNLKT